MRDPMPRAAWSVTVDEFVGPHLVSEKFDIDDDVEMQELYREAPYELEALWISGDGYSVHFVGDDWEPPSTVLVREGEVCGYYGDGACWIEAAHRGRGLSTELILCLVEKLGRASYDNSRPLGFSAAGIAAHRRAHAAAVGRALAAGLPVPDRVADSMEPRAPVP